MSRHLPGAEQAILGRLVVRQDALETRLVQVGADVDRLTRATAALTDTLRKLPTTTTTTAPKAWAGTKGDRDGTTADGAASDGAMASGSATGPVELGQRDWLAVTDPDVALEWLLDLAEWWGRVGEVLVGAPLPCWAWHPRCVAAGLALQAQYVEAYAADRATAVSDLLTRWSPTLGHLMVPRDSECNRHEHYDFPSSGRRAWAVHADQLPDYAHWWATDRTGHPPGLTPRS